MSLLEEFLETFEGELYSDQFVALFADYMAKFSKPQFITGRLNVMVQKTGEIPENVLSKTFAAMQQNSLEERYFLYDEDYPLRYFHMDLEGEILSAMADFDHIFFEMLFEQLIRYVEIVPEYRDNPRINEIVKTMKSPQKSLKYAHEKESIFDPYPLIYLSKEQSLAVYIFLNKFQPREGENLPWFTPIFNIVYPEEIRDDAVYKKVLSKGAEKLIGGKILNETEELALITARAEINILINQHYLHNFPQIIAAPMTTFSQISLGGLTNVIHNPYPNGWYHSAISNFKKKDRIFLL